MPGWKLRFRNLFRCYHVTRHLICLASKHLMSHCESERLRRTRVETWVKLLKTSPDLRYRWAHLSDQRGATATATRSRHNMHDCMFPSRGELWLAQEVPRTAKHFEASGYWPLDQFLFFSNLSISTRDMQIKHLIFYFASHYLGSFVPCVLNHDWSSKCLTCESRKRQSIYDITISAVFWQEIMRGYCLLLFSLECILRIHSEKIIAFGILYVSTKNAKFESGAHDTAL